MSKLLPRTIFPHNAVMAAPSSDSLACPAPYNAITHAPSVVQPRVIVAPQCNHAGPLCRTAPHDRPSLLQDGSLNMRQNAMRRLDSPCAGMPCAGWTPVGQPRMIVLLFSPTAAFHQLQ